MKRKVLIVGAGVAGLSAAWWLSREGWDVTVVERSPDLRTDGYMIGLSGPGYATAQQMGLIPALESRARLIDENLYLDKNGKELVRLRYRDFLDGINWITLSRTELVGVLYQYARDSGDFHFGTELTGFEENDGRVTATLSTGATLEVDLLIAADGAHSVQREAMFGHDPGFFRYLGYRAAAFQVEDTLGLGHDFLSYAEPGRHTEFYTLSDTKLATLYVWRSDETGFVPPQDRAAVLRQAFAGAHPDALQWIDKLRPSQGMYLDDLTMVALPNWHKGRCLLLGDAAHCLTLVSGQGAGMAMTSAMILAKTLKDRSIPEALVEHERLLRPAIGNLQDRSVRISRWFIPQTAFQFGLRNFFMRHLPRPWLAGYFRRGIESEHLVLPK